MVGACTAYLSQLWQSRTSANKEQTQMRRIVYTELGKAFLDLDSLVARHMTTTGEPILHKLRIRVLRNTCAYDGEAYMKQSPAIFYQLEEGEILTWIYHWFHTVDAGSDGGKTYGLAQMRGPLSFFSDCYRKYPAIKSKRQTKTRLMGRVRSQRQNAVVV